MIVIIDYGMGNLHSVQNALDKIGAESIISNQMKDIEQASGIILPGVGAFKDCMKNLEKYKLTQVIKDQVKQGKPFLGICLGMQVLFEEGHEGQITKGLGLLSGTIKKMEDTKVKIPHIGWNRLEITQKDMMFQDLSKEYFVYYVHSYYACDCDEADIVAYSQYGQMKIPGYVHKQNIMGMQFHPEKSGIDGLNLLKKFKEICE